MRTTLLALYKKILDYPGLVFDIQDAALLLKKNKKHVAVYLKKLIDHQLIFRIQEGLYSKTNDAVLIAGNLPFPSYITGPFALFYYGQGEAPGNIDVATPLYKRSLLKWNIRFHKIQTHQLSEFEYKKYGSNNIKIATLNQAKKEVKRFKLGKKE